MRGVDEKDSIYVIQKMDKTVIDFIEISGGSYKNPKMSSTTSKANDTVFFDEYSKKIKPLIKAPIIVTGGIRFVDSMVKIIEENVADFIGIARPLAMDISIPNKIKDDTYSIIKTKGLSTGIKAIDKKLGSLLGLVYYQMLMQKFAKGKTPKITTNAWPALIYAVYYQGFAAIFPQRSK